MIVIEDLRKSYGQAKALDGLSLRVLEGELFAFLGPNGAGKTTTIRILTGLTRLDSGIATINGLNIEKEPLAVKRLCGLVPQQVNLDGELSVLENLDIHGRLFGLSRRERKEKAEEYLTYVEMLDRAHNQVKTLSGGLKRRLTIARALIHSPKVLFLDEPTVGLDAAIRRRIWSLIKKISRSGVTVFLTTHYIEEAEFLATNVAFIDSGKLLAIDSPKAIIDELGQWAVDVYEGEGTKTFFFGDRIEASDKISQHPGSGSIRRVNLEDAFLAKTGKRVD
ncbi:MAG: ATP-binding cassette domain-containing protein [Deltaproteobacteria bacterium]|jgi:ABC-2 type transport system ATP-binding protein|nr:ATP-binding cassette domain-containing protein [Deltaproteobacteria bacterium]